LSIELPQWDEFVAIRWEELLDVPELALKEMQQLLALAD